jgi:hypothetical protein
MTGIEAPRLDDVTIRHPARPEVRVTEATQGLGDPLTHGRMVTKVVPDREPRVLMTCPKYTLLAFSPA